MRFRNFTGTPSRRAGWYCHDFAALTAALSYCGLIEINIDADSTRPIGSIRTSRTPLWASRI